LIYLHKYAMLILREVIFVHISAQRKYHVRLTQQEKTTLRDLIHKGSAKARTITRARILLMAGEGSKDREIIQSLRVADSTPRDTRKHYVQGGLKRALFDAPRPGQRRKLTGVQEAEVVAIACTKAPKGYAHWTIDLLTEEVNKKFKSSGGEISIGRTAIWKVLLRNNLKPWRKKNVVHPKGNT
jgi:transposase